MGRVGNIKDLNPSSLTLKVKHLVAIIFLGISGNFCSFTQYHCLSHLFVLRDTSKQLIFIVFMLFVLLSDLFSKL